MHLLNSIIYTELVIIIKNYTTMLSFWFKSISFDCSMILIVIVTPHENS